ncbi:MAG: 3'-5' exoribonuclease YhaM family protein [Bacilli bacterium]
MIKKFSTMKVGDDVSFYALIEGLLLRFTPNKSSYYSANLSDGEQIVDARIWDTMIVENNNLEKGKVYYFDAHINEYGGKPQFVIKNARQVSEDEIDKKEFFRSAPINEETLRKEIKRYINQIENPILKKIVVEVISKVSTEYFSYPAAMSMHHNYASGLAYHTYSMLRLADTYLDIYPGMSKDLLYAGTIIHDIGKTKELSGIYGTTYTCEGNLLGHIVIGLQMIAKASVALGIEDTEEVRVLSHMIASHHGELEYGSPKEPCTLEAYALHFMDLADAKMAAISAEVVKTEKGKSTNPVGSIGRKAIYRPEI